MASYTYEQIRAGLVANLAPLGIQSKGYILASPMVPTIEIVPGTVNYDGAFQRGHDDLTWSIVITVAITLDEAAQRKLDTYLAPTGTSSVKALVETDTTLGGAVIDLQVVSASGYQIDTQTGQKLSATWTVELVA